MSERGPVTRAEEAEAHARLLQEALERIAAGAPNVMAYESVAIAQGALRAVGAFPPAARRTERPSSGGAA